MAKVRVYELAKDLNMTNRALLNKMKELKIEVKSHMSSLEDSDVLAIRNSVSGKTKQNTDVKVKPSVIRRRKSRRDKGGQSAVSESEFEKESSDSNQAPAPETTEDTPVSAQKSVLAQKEDKAASAESQGHEQEQLSASDEKTVDSAAEPEDNQQEKAATTENSDAEPPKAKKMKKKASEPAKIIRPAVVEKPEEKQPKTANMKDPEPVEPTTKDTASKPEEKTPETKESTDAVTPETQADENQEPAVSANDSEKTEPATQSEPEDQPGKDESPESDTTETEDDQAAQEDKKSKKSKKKKKSTPAKIVRVADPIVMENLRKSGVVDDRGRNSGGADQKDNGRAAASRSDRPNPQGAGFPGNNDAGSDAAKRKKGGRREGFPANTGGGDDNRFGQKKKGRRKKAVIEGDALYNTGGRKKKGRKEAKGKKGKFQKTQITTPKAIKRRVKIDEAIELAELAKRMGIKANEMIVKLMAMGVMATVNQTIDYETASLVAAEFDFEVEKASFEEEALLNIEEEAEDDANMIGRAPVVTIMGHVDHGKTSLLDVIRKSKITSGEAGGITQHIGAYNVETPNGGRITFLDTPGHAAFTAMRSRGAQVTDIVILVVAADDGVMPQTIEAINHSKDAGVPVVVAVNKMDKAGADPDRIMRELSEFGLLAEDWGGDVIFVKVSAKSGEGIDDLLEMVLLQSEVLELKANPDRNATGYVVESRLDTGRGAVATVLIKQGTLHDSDPIVCGLHSGRVRAMIDDSGERIEEAGPSTPVEIVGLNGVPDAGDEFVAVASDKDAKQIAGHRMQKQRAKELAKKSRANLEKMFENLGSAEIKELKLIVKADVQGSIEALNDSLKDLAKDEVDVKIVHSGVGTINESDVSLAGVSDAIIVGFNVRPTPQIRKMAKDENVDMRFYDIIYDVINDIKAALDGMMPSTFHEIIIGRADVRDTFVVPKVGTIAGCHIVEGKVIRGKKVRLLRDGVIKCDTELSSLRRFKDDVKEVDQGYECGIGLEKYNDIKVGDAVECYEVEERKYKGD